MSFKLHNSSSVPVAFLCLFCLSVLGPISGQAQDPNQNQQEQQEGPPPDAPQLSPQQLDSLVAPIALYADPLIAQVLAASTYPLEIVEANRWLQANQGLQGTALTDAAQQQNWDPSVQALVVFPTVLQMLDRNIRWTTDLGNAFLAQEQDVMDAIQRQRQAASQKGELASNEQQTVENQDNYISIEPTQPDTIYVPVYDPVAVWGPMYYNPWGPFWYPPRPYGGLVIGSRFGFSVGFPVRPYFRSWGGWRSWGWGPGWRDRTVVINNNFYTRNNFRRPDNFVRDGSSRWVHSPEHRAGVPYPSRGFVNRGGAPSDRGNRGFPSSGRDGRPGFQRQNTAPPNFPQPNQGRPEINPRGGRPGFESRPQANQPGPQAPRQEARPPMPQQRDRSVWGGMDSGNRTRIESDRGHSSLGNRGAAPPSQASPAPQPQRRGPESRPSMPSRPPGRPERKN